jgi:hypothetical protein
MLALGRFSDRQSGGDTADRLILPCLPPLWLVSPTFYYLLLVQFGPPERLYPDTSNFYDSPHCTGFATLLRCRQVSRRGVRRRASGDYWRPMHLNRSLMPDWLAPSSPLFLVFATSAAFRVLMIAWFILRRREPWCDAVPAA